jgi:Na+/H+ antiporter NhaC
MLGDNISLISDTTIASSRTQGAQITKVFKSSARYAVPAALVTILIFWWVGETDQSFAPVDRSLEPIKVIPYLAVFGLALSGMNVMVTLVVGIALAITIGVVEGNFSLIETGNFVWQGFTNMSDIFILSLLTGGLSFMAVKSGGIEWLLQRLKSLIVGKRSAQTSVALIASLSDVALANNTIAILVSGEVAKEIGRTYDIPKERTASLLDTYSCLLQGVIPYGAQMLILTGFTAGLVSPFDLIPFLFYQGAQALFISLSLFGIDIGVWQNWIPSLSLKSSREKQ